MSRVPVSLEITDLSQFSRSLSKQWPDEKPSHLSLMNLLAKSAGYQNYQHLLASQSAATENRPPKPEPGPDPRSDLDKRTKRWLRLFDEQKRAVRWPAKFIDQRAILWGIASQLPWLTDQSEKQINEVLKAHICFGDFAIVRRELVESGVLGRTDDGKKYWRKSFEMPEDFVALIEAL